MIGLTALDDFLLSPLNRLLTFLTLLVVAHVSAARFIVLLQFACLIEACAMPTFTALYQLVECMRGHTFLAAYSE